MITTDQERRVDAILAPYNEAVDAGTLTRELWLETWRKLEPILGDEPDGMELLYPRAELEWLREVGAG